MMPITGQATKSGPFIWYTYINGAAWVFVWTGEQVISQRIADGQARYAIK